MFKVIASDGRVVGNRLTREMADQVVEMHKGCGKGGPVKGDRSNAAACALLSYAVVAA